MTESATARLARPGRDSGFAVIAVVLVPFFVLALILVLIAAVTSARPADATACVGGASTALPKDAGVPSKLTTLAPPTTADPHPGDSAGCAGAGADSDATDIPGGRTAGSAAGTAAVRFALAELGKPYRWAAAGPDAYDCSGLTMRAWQHAGVQLAHSSRTQYRQVKKISYSELRPGDLLFYATDTGNQDTIHHVSMYIGGGQMIEAPYTGSNVRVTAVRRTGSMPYAGRPRAS
jgi:cell wall-associated NlpC family hydrolase